MRATSPQLIECGAAEAGILSSNTFVRRRGDMTAIPISSGHGKYVRGASGYVDEVDEARKVVEKVADLYRQMDVTVYVFHDDVSTSQSENLDRIVDFHNSKTRDLDISVHFNAYETTSKPMGCEVLYVTQESWPARFRRRSLAPGNSSIAVPSTAAILPSSTAPSSRRS
jgi:N-acetylmuramoyl-L-alanine amidase